MLSVRTPTFLDELGHTPLATGPLPQLLRAALLRSLEPSNPLWAATHWVKVPCRTHEHNPGSAKIRSLGSGPWALSTRRGAGANGPSLWVSLSSSLTGTRDKTPGQG